MLARLGTLVDQCFRLFFVVFKQRKQQDTYYTTEDDFIEESKGG